MKLDAPRCALRLRRPQAIHQRGVAWRAVAIATVCGAATFGGVGSVAAAPSFTFPNLGSSAPSQPTPPVLGNSLLQIPVNLNVNVQTLSRPARIDVRFEPGSRSTCVAQAYPTVISLPVVPSKPTNANSPNGNLIQSISGVLRYTPSPTSANGCPSNVVIKQQFVVEATVKYNGGGTQFVQPHSLELRTLGNTNVYSDLSPSTNNALLRVREDRSDFLNDIAIQGFRTPVNLDISNLS